ncbi:MAG TPA: 16S rRNA (cytosine(967)-C(5))-methyltransferase RsmB, partial [Burkholderiaceae bacterium]|nr:16S rRNA (cytosine(967)-C(5))-methyltransferase RsmB [Burkholderiaceae bacterium]
SRLALSDIIYSSAQMVQAVRGGQSLSEALSTVSTSRRAATRAVSFHVVRQLGMATELKRLLVKKTPSNPLADAVLLVALALLETALRVKQPLARRPVLPNEPIYEIHTIVDQTVRLAASRRALKPFKGLFNACLRRLCRESSVLLEQALKNPVAEFNHPQWWIRLVQSAYPNSWQALLHAANRPGPMTLRVNQRQQTVEQLQVLFQQQGIASQPIGEVGLVLEHAKPVYELPGFHEGWWSVQDAAAQLAADLLNPQKDEYLLDACAAPGGKTAHLLEKADVSLMALDSDALRLKKVQENLQRLKLESPAVQLKCADASKLSDWWTGKPFDAVLADVPCTASGVVRRHPDIRWLRRESDLAQTVQLQCRIIEALWQTVKPGGRLLYATCSIFPQEGEQQAQQFLSNHPDAQRLPAPGQILSLAPSNSSADYDGFFYALFTKRT